MNSGHFIGNLSIKNKIISTVLIVVVTVISIGFILIATWDIRKYKSDIQTSLVLNAKLIGDYCVVPLYFGDNKQATEALLRLKFLESVESGYLFDDKGNLFAAYPDTLLKNKIPPVKTIEQSILRDGHFLITEPVSFQGKVLGVISIRANSDKLTTQRQNLIFTLFVLLLILVLLSYVLAAWIQKSISAPILKLAELTATISENQDFTVHLTPQGKDEVGILYQQFNNLLAQLLKKQKERDQAEENLIDSETHFRYLFEQNPALLLIYELGSLSVLSVNEAFLNHYGYSKSEILSKRIPDLYPENEKKKISKLTEQISGLVFVGEWHHILKDGTQITVEVTSHGFLFEGKSARIAVINDITTRKKVEDEIRILNASLEKKVDERTAMLESANKELEAFSYSVSHDLRAPLRHINGYLELLTKRNYDQLDDKGKHYMQSISESSTQMGLLIDDLLNFSRTSRMEMRKSTFNMGNPIADAMKILEQESKARNIEWTHGPMPDVYADYTMIRQVWVNLLSNAIKYSRRQEIATIETGSYSEANENVFFVKDNGAGFDMNYASKLFGVFQRLHSNEEFEGTGIGLANIRQVIKRHNGRTWAEGEINKGATFYFSLPKL